MTKLRLEMDFKIDSNYGFHIKIQDKFFYQYEHGELRFVRYHSVIRSVLSSELINEGRVINICHHE